ncbi:terminase small subunit (plasmid) [Clostridium perfringens]
MPRVRSPNRDKAFDIYKQHKGNITNREIANILNEDEKVIAVWKSRDKWNKNINVVQQSNKSCTTNKKKNTTNIKKDIKKPIEEEVKEVLENAEITDKQRLFCIYYIQCFNAAKAYKKAYECSYESALSNGYRLMENDSIRKEIETLKKRKLNRLMISEEDIFQRYLDIAYASMTDYLEFGAKEFDVGTKEEPKTIKGNYIYLKNSSEVDGSVISEIKQGKSGISLKLHDVLRALDWLSEHMNIATDKQKAEIEFIKANVNLVKVKAEEVEGRLF